MLIGTYQSPIPYNDNCYNVAVCQVETKKEMAPARVTEAIAQGTNDKSTARKLQRPYRHQ